VSENLRKITKAVYGFDAVARRVADDTWQNPSPCEGWTGLDVLSHSICMADLMRATAAGEEPPAMDFMPEVSEPLRQWTDAREALFAALDQQGVLHRTEETIWGEMPIDTFLGLMAIDPLCHTWDLAQAAGIDAHLDPELCEQGIAQLEQTGDMLRGAGMFAASADQRSESPADRLIALSGRRPR